MYCKNCGMQINNDSKFCTSCGTKQIVIVDNEIKEATSVSQPIQSKALGIENTVKKIELFLGIPNSMIIGYLIWFSIHLILLLISARDSGSRFWPFNRYSNIDDYDFSEFFLYVLIPLIGIVIYGIVGYSNNAKSAQNERYDNSYKRDMTPTIIGLLAIFANFFIIAYGLKLKEADELLSVSSISLALRICVTTWCVNIAKTLNRNKTGWGLFAFFLPDIALISIGMQKKILYSRNYFTKTIEGKSTENNNIASDLAEEKKYLEALFFSDKSIEFNPNNHSAYDTRGWIKHSLEDFSGALKDLNKSIELDDEHAIKFYHRGCIYKEIGKIEESFKDWNISAKMGSNDAKNAIKNNSNIESA